MSKIWFASHRPREPLKSLYIVSHGHQLYCPAWCQVRCYGQFCVPRCSKHAFLKSQALKLQKMQQFTHRRKKDSPKCKRTSWIHKPLWIEPSLYQPTMYQYQNNSRLAYLMLCLVLRSPNNPLPSLLSIFQGNAIHNTTLLHKTQCYAIYRYHHKKLRIS